MVLSIYNHKGGTGKTTTTINLGRALKNEGYKVLLVDLDPQANMTYSLGIKKINVDAVTLSEDNITTTREGLDILPNYTTPQFLVDYDFPSDTSLRDEMDTCFSNYDFVLIDCPPAMNHTVVNALLASNGIILPVLLDVLSLEALKQVLYAIDSRSLRTQNLETISLE
jgi:chromosome partitioning protein